MQMAQDPEKILIQSWAEKIANDSKRQKFSIFCMKFVSNFEIDKGKIGN